MTKCNNGKTNKVANVVKIQQELTKSTFNLQMLAAITELKATGMAASIKETFNGKPMFTD